MRHDSSCPYLALCLALAALTFVPVDTGAQVRIEQRELLNLLESDATRAETLERYFELSDEDPMLPKLRLKDEVEIVVNPDELQLGPGDIMLRAFNLVGTASKLPRYLRNRSIYPRVVAEGDSWFHFPWPGVDDITDSLGAYYAVYPLAAAGDEITNMFNANQILPALRNENADVLLLSGGGNDLLGHLIDFLTPFKPGATGAELLNELFFEKLSQLENVYRALFEILEERVPTVTVITHGYDYAMPGAAGCEKYLAAPMTDKGIVDPALQRAVVHAIIDTFNTRMSALAEQHDNAVFVDVRNTVGRLQWRDEIHPDNNGFQQVAIKLRNAIAAAMRK